MSRLHTLANQVRSKVAPPPALTVDQWAERYLWLPSEVGSEVGLLNPDRFPWQRQVLRDINDTTVSTTALQWATQLGKTSLLLAVIGYFSQHKPSPILVVYPTESSADSFSREKVSPIIAASPMLANLYAEARQRSTENTLGHKKFPGGFLAITYSGSATELRRRSVRLLILDELDAFQTTDEGDSEQLAMARVSTFHDAVVIKSSSPTDTNSRINASLKDSDQQYFFCPCPKCGASQVIRWDNIHWADNSPETAWLECEGCRSKLSDGERLQMISRGVWKPTAPFRGKRGYHLSGFYRVIGRRQGSFLSTFVEEHLTAKQDSQKLIVWTNTVKAEVNEPKVETVDEKELTDNREDYVGIVNGVLLLTAGADFQANRIEASIYGHCADESVYAVEHKVFYGDTLKQKVYSELSAWLALPRHRNDGTPLRLHACLDSGYRTGQVYNFVKGRPRCYAIRGKSGAGLPPVFLPRKTGIGRVRVYQVGIDGIKTDLFHRLASTEGRRVHFNQTFDDAFFKSLLSEGVVEKMVGGKLVRTYAKIFERNEALDCAVYAIAALNLISNGNVPLLLGRLAKQLPVKEDAKQEGADKAKADDANAPAKAEPTLHANRRKARKIKIGGFSSW